MKNRKLPAQKKEENKKTEAEKSKSSIELRSKKRPAANNFLQKSQQILQSYNSLFKKTSYHLGDADTFFRHSLRNYDDFDLFKGVKWDGLRKVQSVRSFEFIKEKKRPALRSGDGDKNTNKLELKKPTVKVEQKEVEVQAEKSESEEEFVVEEEEQVEEEAGAEEDSDLDDDKDKFYSPSSQQIEELEEIKEEDELEVRLEIKPEVKKSVQFEIKLEVQTEDLEEAKPELKFELQSEVRLEVQPEVRVEVEPELKQAKSTKMEEAGDEVTLEDDTVPDTETDMPEDSAATEAPTEFNMSDVENVLEQANTELTEIMEQNPDLADAMDSGGADGTGGNEAFKYDPQSDNMLMKELEDAERQAKETAQIIYELKLRLAQLCSVEKMTDAERDELEEKNLLLKKCMDLFEEKTKRIQFLVGQANLFENMISPRPPLQQKHKEDLLPKVIICGMTQCGNIPKIIVCEDHKKKKKPSVVPQFAKRLSESYNMQEKLAAENADLEGRRYQLQEDLLNKDQTVESLQRKLHSLQAEMRMVCKENTLLSEKLEKIQNCPGSVPPCQQGDTIENQKIAEKVETKKMKCGRGRPCPADVEARLQEYSQTTQQLESQLGEMENEVRNMQTELIAVQKERQHLEHHRRMLCTPPPCIPTCPRPPCAPPPCPGPCNPNRPTGSDQQLRELREQYNRLQDDYKGKLTEVAGLRADNEKLKQTVKDAEDLKKMAEDKMKECERELKQFKMEAGKMAGSKEQLIEQEQQLNVAKQRFREAQDELEELRALIQDQQAQLEDYRNKYLQAQQQVEEQRRQIDMMEMENNRVSEQVNLEIQRVKNQFQEKLQELTPLPDILKATQLKLQEAQQMHLLAERNNEQLSRELQAYRDRAAEMANQMEKVRSDQQLGADEKASLASKIEEWERKCQELQEDNDGLRTELARMEEIAEQNEKRVQEKLHEIAQLVAQLETVREESARQVARTKDRCETVRRSMQNQIADLERQLAQSRAQARAAQKDRDEIRQKMQSQINNLNENFEDAQMRIRNLQGHVNFLKNSYTNVFPPDPNLAMISDGMDACDCGNTY